MHPADRATVEENQYCKAWLCRRTWCLVSYAAVIESENRRNWGKTFCVYILIENRPT